MRIELETKIEEKVGDGQKIRKRWIQTENKDRDGDTEKMRIEMETKKK